MNRIHINIRVSKEELDLIDRQSGKNRSDKLRSVLSIYMDEEIRIRDRIENLRIEEKKLLESVNKLMGVNKTLRKVEKNMQEIEIAMIRDNIIRLNDNNKCVDLNMINDIINTCVK